MSEIITIDSGLEYTVYAGLETSAVYAEGAFGAAADAYRAADDLTKQRASIQATRRFEAANWCGSKTSTSQDLAHPRTGLTDIEGNALSSTSIAQVVIDANIELQMDIVLGTTQGNKDVVDANIRRLKADVAEIEYFRSGEADGQGEFPEAVRRLIGHLLCGKSGDAQTIASGTDGESNFSSDFGFNEGF